MEDISFKGLTSTLKNNIYSVSAIKRLAQSFPNSKGIVGTLPSEWVTKIPIEKRKNFICELYRIFSEIAKLHQSMVLFANKKSSKLLKKFLKDNGIIKENDKLKFRFSGSGSFADVVKFNVNNKKYALKVFRKNSLFNIESLNGRFGNCAEQNNALYINASENADWTKFYFGNIHDGYLVMKYIETDTPMPTKKIKLSDKGLEYLDYDMDNIKNNINLDYGGHKKIENFPVGNKVAMWTIKNLKKVPANKRAEEIEKIAADKNVPNYYDRMVGANYVKNNIIPKDIELSLAKHGFWHSLIRAFLEFYNN